ncbi:MAG: DUF2029 domain-containing protein [bacterium]|nr:DUF2029 domain-containing protein [bacterium]
MAPGVILGACAGAAVIWVFVLAWHRPVPSEDGVSYLWMAERFAAGDWHAGLSTVFPPGFSLVTAPFVALGLSLECAANVVNAVAFGLTIAPLAALARRLGPDLPHVEWLAAVLFLSGSLLARVAAEVYSEPVFLLLMALGTVAGLRRKDHWLGLLSGLAFWVRPEGLLLAASFVLARPRSAWRALPWVAAGVFALALLRWFHGHGCDPLPILGFHEARDDLPERGDLFANAVAIPGAWLEAFGPVGLLALAGLLWRSSRTATDAVARRALWWQVGLQIAVICTFVVRRRFLLSCALPVVAFAAVTVARLPARWRALVVVAAVLFGAIGAWRGRIDPDRIAEREVGAWLGSRLHAGESVTGDLTRVVWFAGQRPLPPRHFDVEQLAAMAMAEGVRYFVFSERRSRAPVLEARLNGLFGRMPLPESLASMSAERGLVVLRRR